MTKTMLRIVSGERRGQTIKTVDGIHTRPTTDRVKESLFNILQSRLPNSFVLDLFSGTGNLGLESLSRGASESVFAEKNPAALRVLKENCRSLDYLEYIRILPYDVKRAITLLSKENKTFDIVFMDPPYSHGLEVPTMAALEEAGLVKDNGIVVVEHLLLDTLPEHTAGFTRYDIRKYGNTAISFYRKDSNLE